MMRMLAVFLAAFFSAQVCFGWSEGGHHLVAVMAFEELTANQQSAVLEILKDHPRFSIDFVIPETAGDPERYLVGRAGYWPDVIRPIEEYSRYTWHFQLGAALVIGNIANVPENPGPCPATATLQTQELYIAQAIELCRKILRDKSQSAGDRAIALCWICHLTGDAHQPCHSGSLYCALFPEGDRGASNIPTMQRRSMHSLWDGLLGPRFDAGDVSRRSLEIRSDATTWKAALAAAKAKNGLNPHTWLEESCNFAKSHAYSQEVLTAVETATKDHQALQPIEFSEGYLKKAGALARKRAAYSAQRLAEILRQDIGDGKK